MTVADFQDWGNTYLLKIVSTKAYSSKGSWLNNIFQILEEINGIPLDLNTWIFLTQYCISFCKGFVSVKIFMLWSGGFGGGTMF